MVFNTNFICDIFIGKVYLLEQLSTTFLAKVVLVKVRPLVNFLKAANFERSWRIHQYSALFILYYLTTSNNVSLTRVFHLTI